MFLIGAPSGKAKDLVSIWQEPSLAGPQGSLGGSTRHEVEWKLAARSQENFEHSGKSLNFVLDTGGGGGSQQERHHLSGTAVERQFDPQ